MPITCFDSFRDQSLNIKQQKRKKELRRRRMSRRMNRRMRRRKSRRWRRCQEMKRERNHRLKVRIFDNVKIICLFKFMDISLHINGLMIIEIEE